MSRIHEANRGYWDANAETWRDLRDEDRLWRRLQDRPEPAFDGASLEMVRSFFPALEGRRICVIGSGDGYAALAFAGMGADVVATDISRVQLDVAASRADELGLRIDFVRSDAADLAAVVEPGFDLAFSSNGFFVWIEEPRKVFSAVHRILTPGGFYIFYDVHPFLRPWKNQVSPIEMEKPYGETGPFERRRATKTSYEFHWTLSDLINPMLEAGLTLRRMAESPARGSSFWQGPSYSAEADADLLDWKKNPRAGLPVWLTVAAQRPTSPQDG